MKTSTSVLETFARCPRRYYYQYERNLVPSGGIGRAGAIGSVYHLACAAGYTYLKRNTGRTNTHWWGLNSHVAWRDVATEFVRMSDVFRDRDDRIIPLADEDRLLVEDMLNLWAIHELPGDLARWETILLVEEPIVYTSPAGHKIRTTLDLLVRTRDGLIEIQDHKTKALVSQPKGYLNLNLQLGLYECSAKQFIEQNLEPAPIDFVHNFIRREVPPGFGHRPATTKSGAKSTASRDIADYIVRVRSSRTPAQLDAVALEVDQILADLGRSKRRNYWRRVAIEDKCQFACSYYETCCGEFDGRATGLLEGLQFGGTLE